MADKASLDIKSEPVLAECCERAVGCRLHLLHGGQVIEARFHALYPGRIEFHVEPGDRNDSLQPGALCCVAFPYQQFICAFVACVKQMRDGATALEVQFTLPAGLLATNLRRSFRVPVTRESQLELTIRLANGDQVSGEALTVSENGLEVNLPSDDGRLPIDAAVEFVLRMGDDRLEMPAIVCRRQKSRRALQIVDLPDDDSRNRFAALRRVVRTLERIWLKNRLV